MQTTIPLYGFGGGGGGTGASLTISAPAGATVTVSKDGKFKTKTAGVDGVAVFKGLSTGEWTVTITDGEQTAQKTVNVTADYSTAITFFSATIHVTYPAGSTCTATDGVTTLTAPDTIGTWDCVVPNAGTWTVSVSNGFSETVVVSTKGEELTINKWYLFNNGDTRESITGGWSITYGRGSGTVGDVIELKTQAASGSTFGTCALSTNNQLDLSGVKKLCFQIICTNSTGTASSTYRRFGYKTDGKIAWTSSTTVEGLTAYAAAAVGDTEASVSVSDTSGYVGAEIKTNYSGGTTTTISAIWIEG